MSIKAILRMSKSGTVALCVLVLASVAAKADMPDVVFELTADAGPISVTIPIMSEWGDYDPETQVWSWSLDGTMDFIHDDTVLATLEQFDVTIREDPEVNLNFSVQAGPAATTFHIASSLLTFSEITNAQGTATAAFTVQDASLTGDGATLTGIGDTGGAYLAQYNGWAGDPINGPSGTTFLEGLPQIVAPAWSQATDSIDQGWTSIADPVTSMSSLISFGLTADDLASGTSHFEIIPEPTALSLLVVGALALLRRR